MILSSGPRNRQQLNMLVLSLIGRALRIAFRRSGRRTEITPRILQVNGGKTGPSLPSLQLQSSAYTTPSVDPMLRIGTKTRRFVTFMGAFTAGAQGACLRLQLAVPVEIVQPAFMQVVRRELPAVIVQVLHRRLEGFLEGDHAGLFGQPRALFQIAGRAGRDHVFPRGFAPATARDHVVEGQFLAAAAILALKAVAQENVEAGEGRVARGLDIGLQADDARQPHREAGRGHGLIILGDDVDTVEEHGLDRVLPGPERQGVITQRPVVGVQNERRQGLRRDCNRQVALLIDSASVSCILGSLLQYCEA